MSYFSDPNHFEPTPPTPETYFLRLDIEQFTFDKPQEEFESAINLELHISMKELREHIMTEYLTRKPIPGDSAKVVS